MATPLRDSLTVDNVSFTYPDGDHPVLDGVSISLPRGTSLALVGGSGAGKSTLVDLILGLNAPSDGVDPRRRC